MPSFDPRTAFDLTDRKVLVTGGSRGLGRAMAEGFARAGADVIVASRKKDVCDATAAEIYAATGRRVVGIPCHVGHWDECDALVEQAYAAFGNLDVLVNNAGMSPLYPSLADVSEELWDKTLGVNLKGAFRISSLVGARMAAAGRGSIISVSSIAAVAPGPIELPYAAAKAGLNAMTIGLARAFGPAVRANVIMPGPFLTDISKAWDLEDFAKRSAHFPLGRGGQAEEVVGAALYLASDASSFTTGAVIKIDGGVAFTPG